MEAVKSHTWLRRFVIWAVVAVAIGGLCWFALHSENPLTFAVGMRHVINQEERFLLGEVDHKVIAQSMRDLAQHQGWTELSVSASDLRVPKELQVLKPSAIWIFDDRIELDFGGAFLRFGFRTFKPGVAEYGTKKIAEGFWFYSEDNYIPTE